MGFSSLSQGVTALATATTAKASRAPRTRRAQLQQMQERLELLEGQLGALLIVVERSAKTLPTDCRFHPDFNLVTMEGYEDACTACRAATARNSILSVCKIVREG